MGATVLEWLLNALTSVGVGLSHLLIWGLCVAGLILSCLSISGTWLILLAAVLSKFLFSVPGYSYIGVSLAICIVVELLEWAASVWGIRQRGGSGLAGWAALAGGLLGMMLGSLVPPPILGSLLGMLIGSFMLAYLVERRRMEQAHAAHIAMGAVVARILILLLKVFLTLALTVALLVGMYT